MKVWQLSITVLLCITQCLVSLGVPAKCLSITHVKYWFVLLEKHQKWFECSCVLSAIFKTQATANVQLELITTSPQMQNGELMKLSIFNEEALGEESQDLDKLVNSLPTYSSSYWELGVYLILILWSDTFRSAGHRYALSLVSSPLHGITEVLLFSLARVMNLQNGTEWKACMG